MSTTVPTARYASPLIALHWLTLLLLVGVYACIEGREFFPRGSAPRDLLKSLHFSFGLTVFALLWLRLALRLAYGAPAQQPSLPAWQRWPAAAVHGVLYLFMLATPLLGWLLLSAGGDPIRWFGIELPALLAADGGLEEQVEDLHETLGQTGYFLIALHAGAALFHHYVLRDGLLLRMWPR